MNAGAHSTVLGDRGARVLLGEDGPVLTAHHVFESLVRAHQDRLYGFACRLTGNRDDAEDLLQQSLIEAYAAFDRFEIGSHFDRWVFRIMHHTFLDTVRRRPRWAIESLDTAWETADGAGETAGRDVPDPRGGPETELMQKTLSEPLQRALDALPADFRAVVVLADMRELSYEEVARVLGCPVGTVRSRLHRARNMLRRTLIGDVPRPSTRSKTSGRNGTLCSTAPMLFAQRKSPTRSLVPASL